jgi:hypothetical protein
VDGSGQAARDVVGGGECGGGACGSSGGGARGGRGALGSGSPGKSFSFFSDGICFTPKTWVSGIYVPKFRSQSNKLTFAFFDAFLCFLLLPSSRDKCGW